MITPPPGFSRASRILSVFSATLLFAALVLAGDPPWMGKPYQDWDEQDIVRIFTDSPWVQIVPIVRNWLTTTGKDLPNDVLSGAARGLPTTPSEASGGQLNFFVFWASSRVMRAASARKAILHGVKKDLDVGKYANEPQEELQILLQSADMTPFSLNDEKFFQAHSFLEMRKSKQRISPSLVLYKRAQKGGLVTAAVFLFPRKTPTGEPTISSEEKKVEFVCLLEGSFLRVGFELQKMVDAKGPAL